MSIKSEVQASLSTHFPAVDQAVEVDGKLIVKPVQTGDSGKYEQVQLERAFAGLDKAGFIVQTIQSMGADYGSRYEITRSERQIDVRSLTIVEQLRIDGNMPPTTNDLIDWIKDNCENMPIVIDFDDLDKSMHHRAVELSKSLNRRDWSVSQVSSGGLGNVSMITIENAPSEPRMLPESAVRASLEPKTGSGGTSRAAYEAGKAQREKSNAQLHLDQLNRQRAQLDAEIIKAEERLAALG